MERKTILALSALVLAALLSGPDCNSRNRNRDKSNDINIRVDRIWDTDRYCAFTSIAKFKGCYYVAFRDDDGHIWGPDGKAEGHIRVIKSKDGERWETFALFEKEGQDLRDPDLSVTPDGRLMLLFGQSTYVGKECVARRPYVTFCTDGKQFGKLNDVVLDMDGLTGMDWLWKVSWGGGRAYGVLYTMLTKTVWDKGRSRVSLVTSEDGIHYTKVTDLDIPAESYPNECSVKMLSDGRLGMLVRREQADRHGWWGVSEAPFTEWKFNDVGMQFGGPNFIEIEGGRIVAGTRTYLLPGSYRTMLLMGGPDGKFKEHTILPSGGAAGDTSYCGFIVEGDELWVSYYSAHENPHPSIYLARIPLKSFRDGLKKTAYEL